MLSIPVAKPLKYPLTQYNPLLTDPSLEALYLPNGHEGSLTDIGNIAEGQFNKSAGMFYFPATITDGDYTTPAIELDVVNDEWFSVDLGSVKDIVKIEVTLATYSTAIVGWTYSPNTDMTTPSEGTSAGSTEFSGMALNGTVTLNINANLQYLQGTVTTRDASTTWISEIRIFERTGRSDTLINLAPEKRVVVPCSASNCTLSQGVTGDKFTGNQASLHNGNITEGVGIAGTLNTLPDDWIQFDWGVGTERDLTGIKMNSYPALSGKHIWQVQYYNGSSWVDAGRQSIEFQSGAGTHVDSFQWDSVGKRQLWRIKVVSMEVMTNSIINEVQWSEIPDRNGTLVGPLWGADTMKHDGDDYTNVPNFDIANGGQQFTIVARTKIVTADSQVLFGQGDWSGQTTPAHGWFFVGDSGRMQFYLTSDGDDWGNGYQLARTSRITALVGDWATVAVTLDLDAGVFIENTKFYFNGKLYNTVVGDNQPPYPTVYYPSTDNWVIGATENNGEHAGYIRDGGEIAMLAIYSKVLTPEEIQSLHNFAEGLVR